MIQQRIDALEQTLRHLIDEHVALGRLIAQKQQALRDAKPVDVENCCIMENQHVQRIGEFEKARQGLLGHLTGAWAPDAAEPLTLIEIAQRIDEPQRGRLLVLRQQLREQIKQVQHANAVAHRATEGLLNHVQGVIRQVQRLVADTGTYRANGQHHDGPTALARSFTVTG